jgi:hypothetical protein
VTEFEQRLSAAGLLGVTDDPQQAAIGDLIRKYNADSAWTQWPPAPDGSRQVKLWKHGDKTPVCKAVVSRSGQVLEDVTEVIA